MTESEPPLDRFRRLHPASIVFALGRRVRPFLIPAVLVLLLAEGDRRDLWVAILLGPVIAWELCRYAFRRYRVTDTALVIREGIFVRSERVVPRDRVQEVALVQGPLHRLLRVADVRIETAGGATEAELKVISTATVERLRARLGQPVAGGSPSGARPAAASAAPLVALSTSDLVRHGLTSTTGVAPVAVATGLAWELDLVDRIPVRELASGAGQPAVLAVLVVGALVALRLLAIGWMLVRFHGYRLARDHGDLRVTCGLFTRISAVIPDHRIQLVSVRETVLQRLMGRVTVRIETAAAVRGDRDVHEALRRWFVPTMPREELPRLLAALHPSLAGGLDAPWRPLADGAATRMLWRNALVALALTAAAAVLFWPWGLAAALLAAPLAAVHARRDARFTRYATTDDGILYRSGAFTRRLSATFFDKLQVISVGESPLDRRRAMATLHADTAGAGPAGHAIRIRYLSRATADALAADLARRAASLE